MRRHSSTATRGSSPTSKRSKGSSSHPRPGWGIPPRPARTPVAPYQGGGMYEGLKLLHVLAVVLFVGNITTGVFWKAFADRTKDPRLIAHTMAGIIASDRAFTIPGVFLILTGGIGAALVAHLPLLRTP